MSSILAWQNLADGAAALSADSEQASLPASNVRQPHISRKWYTAAGVKSAYLLLDLGSSLSCAMLAVLGTNLTSSATLRLRGSVTDPNATGSLAYDSGLVNAGVKTGFGAIYLPFTSVAARYWRLDLADTTVADTLQAGRLFLGPRWNPALGVEFGQWAPMVDDPSRIALSYGGQSHPEILPKTRGLQFTLNYLSDAEAFASAHALMRAVGVTTDVLMVPQDGDTYLSEQAVWGLMTALNPIFHLLPQTWSQRFEIKERL